MGFDLLSYLDSLIQGDAIYILPTSSFCTGSCHSILHMSEAFCLDHEVTLFESALKQTPLTT